MLKFLRRRRMYQNIDSKSFQDHVAEDKDAVVIDVRTYMETMEGMIPNALHIDIMGGRFKEEVEKLDKDKSYYIYCRSGNRSGTACSYMASLGFTKLYNLSGGMMFWDGEVAVPR
jgi:rhodanese-related sulfurtransferase